MQPNQIDLEVDVDNTGSGAILTPKVFLRFRPHANRSEYVAETHSLSLRDTLGLYRTQPKQNKDFRGVAKSAIKITQDFRVEGVDTTTVNIAPGIVDVGFSFPIGMTPAQTREMRMRVVALLLSDTVMVPLTDQLLV